MKVYTYQYRGKPVKLFKKGKNEYSLRVEADPKRGLKNVTAKAARRRLAALGIKTSKGTTVPVKRLSKAAARRKAQDEARAILAALDARRKPVGKQDWYETQDYRDYCRCIGADSSVTVKALVAGIFSGPLPRRTI